MKRFKLIFIFIMLFLISGCTSKYTLTYEDDKFSEELIISNISKEDERNLIKYESGSKYLEIDENNSYMYKTNDKNEKIYSYDMGKELVVSPLINTCFEDVYIIKEDDYILIKTEGDYYCSNYNTEVYFKTDKKVMYSNSKSVDNNVYKWDSLEDGINIQFSTTQLATVNDSVISKDINSLYIRLIISIVFIVIVIFTVSYFKKKNNSIE